jgi:ribosome-binding factor A
MPHDTRRPDRVAEAIREAVATFLAEGVKDPRITGLVTVTGAQVTRDLRHAKVFVSVLGSAVERAATFEGLTSLAGYLRSHLGRDLRLRLAPEITFHLDDSIAYAARIESLLGAVKSEHRPEAGDAAAEDAAASPPADSGTPGDAPGDRRGGSSGRDG